MRAGRTSRHVAPALVINRMYHVYDIMGPPGRRIARHVRDSSIPLTVDGTARRVPGKGPGTGSGRVERRAAVLPGFVYFVSKNHFFSKCRLTVAALSPAHPRSRTNYPVPYASARLHTPATCPRQACAEEDDARATRHQRAFACRLLARCVAEHTMLHTTAARCDTVFGRDIIRSHNHHTDHLRLAL